MNMQGNDTVIVGARQASFPILRRALGMQSRFYLWISYDDGWDCVFAQRSHDAAWAQARVFIRRGNEAEVTALAKDNHGGAEQLYTLLAQ